MALSSLDKLKDQLICAVCLDLYANPKTLPCHHSFCLQCLEMLPLDPQEDHYFIDCPTCRQRAQLPPEGPAAFPAAFHLNNLMETYTQMNRVFDPQQMTCPNHQKPLEIFCETCHQVICLHCTDQNHKDHNWKLVTDSYPEHCRKLELSLNPVKEKVNTIKNILTAITNRQYRIKEQSESIKQEINEMEEEMISAICKSARQLTREVETVTDDKLRVLSKQQQSAESSLKFLMDCKENVEQNIGDCSQQQLLMHKKQMMESMSQVTQEINVEEFLPLEKADMKLLKNIKITEGVHHIGDILFTSLEQCKVKEIDQAAVHSSLKEVSFPLSLECPDSSLLTVPVSSITCSLVPPVGRQPITAIVTSTTHPGVCTIHCSPSTNGLYQVNVQINDAQLESTPLLIPFNPYLDTITPVHTIGKLNRPQRVAVSEDGSHVIVTEWGGHCVTVLDREGRKVKSFGGRGGSGNVKFVNPSGIAITPDNLILVTDNHRIQKITMDGKCTASFGKEGSGQLQLSYPAGIAISPTTEHIYIVDSFNHRIQLLTSDLTFLHSFGSKGSTEGQLQYPCDIAIDNKGLLYVTDMDNHRIQVFTPEGQFVTQFGTKGSGLGQLTSPVGITVDKSRDLLYVTEEGNNRMSIFTSEGEFVNSFGKELFDCPTGISYVNRNLFICDSWKKRLIIV